MPKLRVLLVPDYFNWILGTWAKEIVRTGKVHEYYFFSQQMLTYHANEWEFIANKVDVIHVLSDFGFEQLNIPKNIPRIGSIHHVDTSWQDITYVTQTNDATMTVANEWKEFLCERGVPPERICLFNNGVDTAKFYPLGDRISARTQLGIHSDTFLIGYSSKYTSDAGGRKGVDVLLKSLHILATAGHKFGVIITGPGWDKVVNQIKSYGISEVYYFPFLPDKMMPICYNALNSYVVTAKIEGGPVPVLNNMACGTPVVTTPVGLVKDYIQDGINGLVVPKGDAEATAQAIVRLIQSPELCTQLAKAALQTIKSHLTWDKTLAGIEQLYEQVWAVKTGQTQPQHLTMNLAPAQQRQWALNIDSYLWNLKLCAQGHPREGLRGIVEGGLGVAAKETARVVVKEAPVLLRKLQR